MKIDINNVEQMLSHVLLEAEDFLVPHWERNKRE